MIAVLAVFCLAAYPGRAAGGEAGRAKEGNPERKVPASRASERSDALREREREHKEMGFERPYERQRLFLQKRSPDGVSPLPMEKYVKALEHMELMPQYSTVAGQILPSRGEMVKMGISESLGALGTWSWLGPGNIGGRTRALLIHPTTPAIMYAAGVSGGIWKSTDTGASWRPLADLMANIAVCTLAMDPRDANVIYAGTGESFVDWRGAGIFKTTDGGATWKQLAATNISDFYYVNKIVVSPIASNRVYAATSTGVWRSTDSGVTWIKAFATHEPGSRFGTTDLVIRTDQATDVVLAADGLFEGAVYRNLDAGGAGTWTAVYTEPNMSRTSLAIAPSNQRTIYALVASSEDRYFGGLLAVLQSTDGGSTWTARVRNADPTGLNTCLLSECDCANNIVRSQGWYDNVIAVDPLDPNRVWAGGIYIFRSDDGGATWGHGVSNIHPDQHAIVFHPQFNGTTNQQMYVGNDGGVWRTENARGTTSMGFCAGGNKVKWTDLNNGYGVTQFYHGVPYPGGTTYFGGTQDNGTIRGTDGSGPNTWKVLPDWNGDAFHVALDPGNTNVLYIQGNAGLHKTTDGGQSWIAVGIPGQLTNFVMDPSNAQILWTGTTVPWRSTDGATTWVQVGTGDAFKHGSTSAIAVAPTDSNYVLFGEGSSRVARSHTALTDDSSSAWAWVDFPESFWYLSCLTFDPTNKNIAYATFSSFGAQHVWKSTDGGATFVNIDGAGVTGIPDIPVNTIVVDPTNTSRLYIGTDLGVFTSLDAGANWAVENTGFANVITEALAITGSNLFAFTHGRGAYRAVIRKATNTCSRCPRVVPPR